jgi:hypothetical protein
MKKGGLGCAVIALIIIVIIAVSSGEGNCGVGLLVGIVVAAFVYAGIQNNL